MGRTGRRWLVPIAGVVLFGVGAFLLSGWLGWAEPVSATIGGAVVGWLVTEGLPALFKRLRDVPEADLQEAKRRLGLRVQRAESDAQQRALAGRRSMVPVRFRSAGQVVELGDLAGLWASTPSRRLAVVGGSGSGKTFAISRMIRELHENGDPARIPVRIPAASQIRHGDFDAWLARALVLHHELPLQLAEEMVAADVVLPFIDGVDELSLGDAGDDASTRHSLMRMINSKWSAGALGPVVITTRDDDDLVAMAQLGGFAVARAQDVTWSDAADHVGAEGDPVVWRPYLEAASNTRTRRTPNPLNTPLRLSLGLLRCRAADEVVGLMEAHRQGGLARFLMPAFLRLRGLDTTGGRRWGTWWQGLRRQRELKALRVLADYLESNRASPPREIDGQTLSGTDLVPHQLWPIGGVSRVIWADTVLALVLSLPGLLLIGLVAVRLELLLALAFGAAFLALYGVMLWGTTRKAWLAPSRFAAPRWSKQQVIPPIVLGALAAAIVTPLLGWPVGLLAFLGVTAAAGLTVGATQALVDFPEGESSPWAPLVGDRQVSLLSAAAVTPTIMAIVVALGLGWWWAGAAIAYGVLVGATVAAASWRGDVAFRLASPFLLPLRLQRFTNTMYDVGVLRISGGAFQFAHLELQEWLASHAVD